MAASATTESCGTRCEEAPNGAVNRQTAEWRCLSVCLARGPASRESSTDACVDQAPRRHPRAATTRANPCATSPSYRAPTSAAGVAQRALVQAPGLAQEARCAAGSHQRGWSSHDEHQESHREAAGRQAQLAGSSGSE
eukprot:scaffold46293_cov70-Phaeocystis_antarctica.AAC.7